MPQWSIRVESPTVATIPALAGAAEANLDLGPYVSDVRFGE
jgi:hypothetical protein